MCVCLYSVFITVFSVILIMVEARVPLGFLQSHILHGFVPRGFLYCYIGNTLFLQAAVILSADLLTHRWGIFISWTAILLKIAGSLEFGLGLTYAILGMACVGALREHVVHGNAGPSYSAVQSREIAAPESAEEDPLKI